MFRAGQRVQGNKEGVAIMLSERMSKTIVESRNVSSR